MNRVTTFVLLLALLAVSPVMVVGQSKKEIGDLVSSSGKMIPLVIIGEGWSQQFILQNVGSRTATGTIRFWAQDGSPWEVELVGRGTRSTFPISLLPDEIVILETKVEFHGQLLGTATVGFSEGDRTTGQTIFRRQEDDRPDFITSFPLGEGTLRVGKLRIPFDNRDGKYAGVGLFHLGLVDRRLRIRLRDAEGLVFHEEVVAQAFRTLWWFSLSAQYPQSNGRIGTLEVTDADGLDFLFISGFSLQFTPNGAFTAVVPFEE